MKTLSIFKQVRPLWMGVILCLPDIMKKNSIVLKPAYLFWLPCLVPLLGACEREELPIEELPFEVNTVAGAYSAIIGEWEWDSTSIYHRGQNPITRTPDTENKTIWYVFRENGTAVKIENGSDFVDYKFEIKELSSPGALYLTLSPIDENIPIYTVFLIFSNRNLIFSNGLFATSYHSRKKNK